MHKLITRRRCKIFIIESKNYVKDYKKLIINKHLTKEKEKIDNIKNVIIVSNNLQKLINSPYKNVYYIEKKKGDLKEYYSARINEKLRLIMKPIGEYPYNNILIDKIEFIKIDDKHYGEG